MSLFTVSGEAVRLKPSHKRPSKSGKLLSAHGRNEHPPLFFSYPLMDCLKVNEKLQQSVFLYFTGGLLRTKAFIKFLIAWMYHISLNSTLRYFRPSNSLIVLTKLLKNHSLGFSWEDLK